MFRHIRALFGRLLSPPPRKPSFAEAKNDLVYCGRCMRIYAWRWRKERRSKLQPPLHAVLHGDPLRMERRARFEQALDRLLELKHNGHTEAGALIEAIDAFSQNYDWRVIENAAMLKKRMQLKRPGKKAVLKMVV